MRMPFARFLMLDSVGAFLWAVAFVVPGYVFHDQLERLVPVAARLGGGLFAVLIAPLSIYLALKYAQRSRFLRTLRGARITPEELKQRLDAGEDLEVVDLRHALDFESYPHTIPGATWISLEEINERHSEISRNRDVVLYCR
jgi:hypothetical protein